MFDDELSYCPTFTLKKLIHFISQKAVFSRQWRVVVFFGISMHLTERASTCLASVAVCTFGVTESAMAYIHFMCICHSFVPLLPWVAFILSYIILFDSDIYRMMVVYNTLWKLHLSNISLKMLYGYIVFTVTVVKCQAMSVNSHTA